MLVLFGKTIETLRGRTTPEKGFEIDSPASVPLGSSAAAQSPEALEGGGVCRCSPWRLGPRPPPGAGPGVGKAGSAVTKAPPCQRPPTAYRGLEPGDRLTGVGSPPGGGV